MDDEIEKPKLWRWPGVLLALFVPGFGHFRAGHYAQGLAWFFGLAFLGIISALVLVLPFFPFWLGAACIFLGLGLTLVMLIQSFRPGKMKLPLWALFVLILAATTFAPGIPDLLARTFAIPTGGMEPTLRGKKKHGVSDWLLADLVTFRFRDPKRGEIIIFTTGGIPQLDERNAYFGLEADVFYVKRVVGLPNETITMEGGAIFADGKRLSETDGIPPFEYLKGPKASYRLADREFFVLGDNTGNSADSRYWGAVPRENVFGRVARIYFPLNRIRSFDSNRLW
ncbi:MAG: signal peptidase I [Verrucomicrobiota bacterium]